MPGGWSSLENRLFQSSTQVRSTDDYAQHMLCQMLPSSFSAAQLPLIITDSALLPGGCKALWLMASKRPQALGPL